jgi:hypothetical protein
MGHRSNHSLDWRVLISSIYGTALSWSFITVLWRPNNRERE